MAMTANGLVLEDVARADFTSPGQLGINIQAQLLADGSGFTSPPQVNVSQHGIPVVSEFRDGLSYIGPMQAGELPTVAYPGPLQAFPHVPPLQLPQRPVTPPQAVSPPQASSTGIPVPCMPLSATPLHCDLAVGLPAELRILRNSIVDAVSSNHQEKHIEVLEAMSNVNVTVGAPDLSSVLNALSGIASAINGVGDQVAAQGKVLQAMSRRLDVMERGSPNAASSAPASARSFRSVDAADSPGREDVKKLIQTEFARSRSDTSGLLKQLESSVQELRTSSTVRNSSRSTSPSSSAGAVDFTPVLKALSDIPLMQKQLSTVHQKITSSSFSSQAGGAPPDAEVIAAACVKKLAKANVALSVDNSQVLQEIQKLRKEVDPSTIVDAIAKIDFSVNVKGAGDLAQSVKQKRDEPSSSRGGWVKPTDTSTTASTQARSTRSWQRPVDGAATAATMGGTSTKSSSSPETSSSQSRLSRLKGADSSSGSQKPEAQTAPRSGAGSSPVRSSSPSATNSKARSRSNSQTKRVSFDGNSSRPAADNDSVDGPFACICGYTCGTAAALERHLARFAGQPGHAPLVERQY